MTIRSRVAGKRQRTKVLSVRCAICGAAAGRPCVAIKDGAPIASLHVQRFRDAGFKVSAPYTSGRIVQ